MLPAAYALLCVAIVLFLLTMLVIAGPTQPYQIAGEALLAIGAIWLIQLSSVSTPRAASGESVLAMLTVFFTFATLGPLIIMVFGGDEAGIVSGLVAAGVSGLISAGWAGAFAFRALWLLPLVVAFQIFVPERLFAWLDGLGALDNFGDLELRVRKGVLAKVSVICVEIGNAIFLRLVGGVERGRARAEAQLATAAAIHGQIVPEIDAERGGAHVVGRSEPSSTMGGDFIDLIDHGDGRFDFVLGDVSGHGVRAGVLMALAKGATRAVLDGANAVEEAAARLNDTLCDATDDGTFVTAVLMRLEEQAGRLVLSVVNAGHPPPVRLGAHAGRLEPGQLPLGVMRGERYEAQRVELSPGEVLVIHSDGIPEAGADIGRVLGLAAVDRACARIGGSDARALVDGLFALARAHASPDDDMSVLVVAARESGRAG